MSDTIAILVWTGGAIGAIDAGRGALWAALWPYHVAKSCVTLLAPPAAMKDGGDARLEAQREHDAGRRG